MQTVPSELFQRFPAKLWKSLSETNQFAFDLECEPPEGGKPSDAKDARLAVPTLLTIATDKYDGAFDLRDPQCCELIATLLKDPELEFIVHNAQYDVVVLDTQGIVRTKDIKAKLRDSMLLQFMIDENQEKGLKPMASQHLRRRMASYDETTIKNPRFIRKAELEARIKTYEQLSDRFDRMRPWPSFSSDRLMKLSDVRKKIEAKVSELWPGEPIMDETGQPIITKTGKTRVKHTTEEKQLRKQFKDEQAELIERHFGLEAQMEFTGWVHNEVVVPSLAEIEELTTDLHRDLVEYAKEDSRATLDLWNRLAPKIDSKNLGHWLDIESYIRRITVEMATVGIPADTDYLKELLDIVDPLIEEFRNNVANHAGRANFENSDGSPLNPDSPDQLRRCVFVTLNSDIPVFYRTQDGREMPKLNGKGNKWLEDNPEIDKRMDLRDPSTIPRVMREKYLSCDSEVLERIDDPIGMEILNLRALTKLRSTYIVGSIKRVEAHDTGRLLGYFNSIGTDTGRLSSSDPNLQNIPSRKKPTTYDERIQGLGPLIRNAFVAGPGKVMIVADQSQVELRIITEFTRDPTLLSIYNEAVEIDGILYYTGDIHAKTAGDLGIPRKLAKNVNFGFNYGMGALKFARQIRLFNELGEYDIPKAELWREGFFSTYPQIEAYTRLLSNQFKHDRQREFKMLSGRKKHYLRDDIMRGGTILNHKVQGSSADLLKINMMVIDRYVRPVCPSLELLFQVHDELGYQVDPHEAELAATLIKYVMEQPWIPMVVPILASAKTCPSWAAKDDDNIPEIGDFFARIDGVDRLFTKETWPEYLRLEASPDHKIDLKAATAILSHEQLAICRKYIPRPQDVPELVTYFSNAA